MISCKDYVEERKKVLKEEISKYEEKPRLVVVQVDTDPASNSYIYNKRKACMELGIEFVHYHIASENYDQDYVEHAIRTFANERTISGIIIQLPIPDKYDLDALLKCIPPEKDVDGFRRDSYFKPCTPKGVVDWLKFNNYEFKGKDAVVVGRSEIVGKPLVNMLIDEGATVSCCNSSSDVPLYTQCADIVLSAIGKPKYFDHEWFDENSIEVIVDIGINRDEDGKLCGDVDRKDIEEHYPCVYVTPVPGGVGPMTVISLMDNTFEAFKLNLEMHPRIKLQEDGDILELLSV